MQEPFAERVLDPLLRQFVRLGNRFTPADRIQKIRRRLDLAGNPPGWDPDRVIGLKGFTLVLGLLLLVLGSLVGLAGAVRAGRYLRGQLDPLSTVHSSLAP